MALRWSVVMLFLVAALLARPSSFGLADAHAQTLSLQYACSPAPSDCSAWYRTDVTVTWTVSPPGAQIDPTCVNPQTVTSDTAGTPVTCSASYMGDATSRTKSVKVDKTPPLVTGAVPVRGADANGWYHQAVAVAFQGVDATSGIQSCSSTSFAGPDAAVAQVPGTCTDVAGNTSAPGAFALPFDATAPVITRGIPARKPDHGRWYNRPVAWHFRAKDALSGLAQCPAVIVGENGAGPTSSVTGACSDRAGNVGTRVFALHYDATPPAAATVRAQGRDHGVLLSVRAAAGTASIRISRSPGRGGARRSTVYHGRPKPFADRHLRNGHRYRYTVTSFDRAHNAARRRVIAIPGPRLLRPAAGATVAAPLLLRWTPVRNASYYNVQLYRDGRKVMSAWPVRARQRIGARWRFAGHAHTLTPGRYRWYVWPGFGTRAERRFGRLVGSRSFVVSG